VHYSITERGCFKATGEAKPSFLLTQLEEMEAWPTVTAGDEEDLKGTAAAMFTAGESTVSVFPTSKPR
jgi:hypothetical protein